MKPKNNQAPKNLIGGLGVEVIDEIEEALEVPGLWDVIFHNDDYTTVDFVTDCLKLYFDKDAAEAEKLTWRVHSQGMAVIGSYSKEIAETRVVLAKKAAEEQQYPLNISLRKQ